MAMKRCIGIFFLMVGAYILFVLGSFYPNDPSWGTHTDTLQVENMGGRIGAYIAYTLHWLFGKSVLFLLPSTLFYSTWVFFKNQQKVKTQRDRSAHPYLQATIWMCYLVCQISMSSLAALHFRKSDLLESSYGGSVGMFVSNPMVENFFGFFGATIILLGVGLIAFTLATGISWLKVAEILGRYLWEGKSWVKRVWSRAAGLRNLVDLNFFKRLFTRKNLSHQRQDPVLDLAFGPREVDLNLNTLEPGEENAEKAMFEEQSLPEPLPQSPLQPSPQSSRQSLPEPLPQSPLQPSPEPLPQSSRQSLPEPLPQSPLQPSPEPLPQSSRQSLPEPLPQSPLQPSPEPLPQSSRQSSPSSKLGNLSLAKEKEKAADGSGFEADAKPQLPALDLLHDIPCKHDVAPYEEIENIGQELERKLKDFGIEAKVLQFFQGPIITRFEIVPSPGTKSGSIVQLEKDLARSLSTTSLRVVEVIPGKSCLGIEIPNKNRAMISLCGMLQSPQFKTSEAPLSIALGVDIYGEPVFVNLAKLPHLLVAGTTGSGKSVAVHSMLMSVLYRNDSSTVRLILIDPKMLELNVYADIPHLLTPVVTDMEKAVQVLQWALDEMERRYLLMSTLGVRNLESFNQRVKDAIDKGQPIPNPLEKESQVSDDFAAKEQEAYLGPMPFIMIVIDEFADLVMVIGKKLEGLVVRLAQKARAAGLHLILATQRPSVDVITGILKANIPARIALLVSSKIDSRTILDQGGAEQLLGNGDMLYLSPGSGIPVRLHGAFVSEEEVLATADHWRKTSPPKYVEEISAPTERSQGDADFEGKLKASSQDIDPYFGKALTIVTQTKKTSISYLQRRLRVGYNRAARILEEMEEAGYLSSVQENGARRILMPQRQPEGEE